jgi:NADH:ubiquinone reductase (H+-translocating)
MINLSKVPFLGLSVSKKPRLVILGTGWAATSILKTLKPSQFDTIVISPSNYFLFTPLLPGATTGTVEYRSLLESARKICKRSKSQYVNGSCRDIDLESKTVSVKDNDGLFCDIQYDKLVIALGARNATYEIPGVKEHVNFCKSITDARKIREKIITRFDQANFPSISEQEKQRLMTFVIVGGGPTGVEFAAELHDFLNKELIQHFPDLVKRYVRVILIQGADHVLNTFDQAISSYTEDRFQRQKIQVVTNAFVTLVEQDSLTYKIKMGEKWETLKTPYGMCVWSTGIAMHEITKSLSLRIDPQTNSKALRVDENLKVIGTGDVYALGDC